MSVFKKKINIYGSAYTSGLTHMLLYTVEELTRMPPDKG